MMTPSRFRLSAALVAGALLAGACGGPGVSGPPIPGTGDARLRITALVVGTPIDLMVATVTAPDIAAPLVFNLPVEAGVATGTLRIPPGQARTILLEAFDALGFVTHEGSATVDVQAGTNPPVSIAMLPRGGDVPVTATLAEFSILVTPASATVPAGGTIQFTAQILDPDDNPLAGSVAWAVTNPAFARIAAGGLATGVAPGALTVVATFGGVAGTAQLTVTDGVTGTVQGTVTSPEFGPLPGVVVSVGALGSGTGAGGAYVIAGVPEGPATVSVGGLPAACADPGPQAVQVVANQATTVDFSVTCTITAGQVIVTEIMAYPVGTTTDPTGERGEWIELYNGSDAPVDVSGWGVHNGYGTQFNGCVIGNAVIAPGTHLVVGPVTDPAQNGGIEGMVACLGYGLPNGPSYPVALLQPPGQLIDGVAVLPVEGSSFSRSPTAYNPSANDPGPSWCVASTPYGTAGNLGTPGQLNPVCP